MKYADDYSGYGNEVLYRMCEEKPYHDSIDAVRSKIWLIGRSYSASIERKAGKNFKIDDAAEVIKNSDIDARIKKIKNIDRPTHENLTEILDLHAFFVKILKEITGVEKRSLASKYLHFHAPKAIFIYDSIANKKLRSKLEGKRFDYPKLFDDDYAQFCVRAIYYRDTIFEPEIGSLASPRRLDMYLLDYGL